MVGFELLGCFLGSALDLGCFGFRLCDDPSAQFRQLGIESFLARFVTRRLSRFLSLGDLLFALGKFGPLIGCSFIEPVLLSGLFGRDSFLGRDNRQPISLDLSSIGLDLRLLLSAGAPLGLNSFFGFRHCRFTDAYVGIPLNQRLVSGGNLRIELRPFLNQPALFNLNLISSSLDESAVIQDFLTLFIGGALGRVLESSLIAHFRGREGALIACRGVLLAIVIWVLAFTARVLL